MLSIRAQEITPSATNELNGTVADMKEQGIDVIGLNVGEPDFITPGHIIAACNQALAEGKTKYCKVTGILPLRKAICDKLKADNHVQYEPDQIVVCTGAKQALYDAVEAILDPEDEAIIPIPCWVSYAEMVKLAGAVPVFVNTMPGSFELDLQAIENAITEKTKAIMINTPNNPTGAVYSENSLRGLGELAVKHNIYIISDEVYEKLVYGEAKHVSIASLSPEICEHSVTVNGFSKAYAMTGWRLGYAAASKQLAKAMGQMQGHMTSHATVFAQWAAVEALTGTQEPLEEMRKEFDKRRIYLMNELNKLPNIKCTCVSGAFYLMPDVSAYYGKAAPDGEIVQNSYDFCNYILKEAHVAIVPGAAFLSPDNVRIAYSNSMDNIRKAIERMRGALEKLQ